MKRVGLIALIVVVAGGLGLFAARLFVPPHATASAAPLVRTPSPTSVQSPSLRSCGTITWTKDLSLREVDVANGATSCGEAMKIANTYFNGPLPTPQPSSSDPSLRVIDHWTCQDASAATDPTFTFTGCRSSANDSRPGFIVRATGKYASPSPQPPQQRTLCGSVKDSLANNSLIQVTIVSGNITCTEALHVADEYYNNPADAPQGSSGISSFEGWTCESTSGNDYQTTGHGGDCTNGTERISLDKSHAG